MLRQSVPTNSDVSMTSRVMDRGGDLLKCLPGAFLCWHHSMPFRVGALAPTVMVWLFFCTSSNCPAAPCFYVPMFRTQSFSFFLSPVIIHAEQLCSYTYRMTEKMRLQITARKKRPEADRSAPGRKKIYPKNTISVYPYINVPCNRIFAAQKRRLLPRANSSFIYHRNQIRTIPNAV